MEGDPQAGCLAWRAAAARDATLGCHASRAAWTREHAARAEGGAASRGARFEDPHTGLHGALDRAHQRGGVRRVLRSATGPRLRHGRELAAAAGDGRRGLDSERRTARRPAVRPGDPIHAPVRPDSGAAPRGARDHGCGRAVNLDPQRTVFVILSFEGPDQYSQAGGLGVRVKGLSRSLARMGYLTYLYFCGDPDLPGEEAQEGGRLQLRRWCQWISALHRGGVYDGEEGKIRDWNYSLPASLIDDVIAPAAAEGKWVVVLGEEWHTSWSMRLISDSLYYRGLRDRVVMLWNANNTFGFHRINWGALTFASTITTVSRYMKFRMWEQGQNPVVIPNGIPRDSIRDFDPHAVAEIRAAAAADHLCFKIGRFDPDKRWLMAIAATAVLKRGGSRVRLVIRGGREAHGLEVLAFAKAHGLASLDAESPASTDALAGLLREP